MTPQKEDKSRWAELAITILVSAVTSAIAVSWSLSSMLTEFRAELAQHDREIIGLDARISAVDNHAGDADTKIAVLEAHYLAIKETLDEIKLAVHANDGRPRR